MSRRSLSSLLSLALVLGVTAALYGFAKPNEPPQAEKSKQPPETKAKALTATLGGAERFLTSLSTDKPIYREGEPVFVRGVVLNAANHRPLAQQIPAMVKITGPKGDTVFSGWTTGQDAVVGLRWDIPEGQAGGEYTAQVSYPATGYPPAERKFDIRAYRAPRLKTQIVFVRDGYGPGDEVAASLHVERAESGVPTNAKVTAIARVDGVEVFRGPASSISEEGNCETRFKLPGKIARGEGTLAMVVNDGAAVETASKTIPILLQTVDLQLYPEGGDLVAGLPTRVYLEARTPAQKPADLAGIVVDSQGQQVAEFRTRHEGRGRFAFTPKAGQKYTLKIQEPSGIKTTYPLPEVKPTGGVIGAVADQYEKREAVSLKVGSAAAGKFRVTLSKREVEVAADDVTLAAGEVKQVRLTPPEGADGVLIATLSTADGRPLAERLVFRQLAQRVKLTITQDKKRYVPGGSAKLTIRATDEAGKPVSAVVGLTVTDESVLEMIDKREQAPRLPVMVLLESDVRELADAHVYLDEKNEKAPLAVDLLLATQGWRRFAFVDVNKFLAAHGDQSRRVLALSLASRRELNVWNSSALGARFGGQVFEGLVDGVRPPQAAAPQNAAEPAAPPAPAAPAPVKSDLAQKGAAAPDAAKPAEAARAGAKGQAQAAGDRAVGRDQLRELPPQERPKDAALDAKREPLRKALQQAEQLARRRNLVADEVQAIGGALHVPVVRVYAHQLRPNRRPGDRQDFTETLYWSAGVKTDAATGEASVEFALSDSVTSFRVMADAFTSDGALGQGSEALEVVEPFYLEPKLPLEVTSGDVIQLPIGVVNATDERLTAQVRVEAANGASVRYPQFTLEPNQRVRRRFNIHVSDLVGPTQLTVSGQAGAYADKVTRTLKVTPLGFPAEIALGGLLGPDAAATHKFAISQQTVPGSLTASVQVFPTPLANLTSALERMIREPYGCFEQTSSTTYPLVMAQQYFQSHTGVDPQLIERSNAMLEKGYKRLTGFECKQHGYEWFGGDPGHEALTAYGLLEFADMAKVRSVDSAMLDRTRQWLLKTRDGAGGFTRKRRALHTWLTDADASNSYILWALLESGQDQNFVSEEVAALYEAAGKSKNSYVLALAANVSALGHEQAYAKKLMDRLVSQQTKDGWVDGATLSIVGSGGEALKIETTALAVLAWLRDPNYAAAVEKGMKYLADSCESGRFGSTQSTVLALRAIVEYDKSRAHPKQPGSLQLVVDGDPVGQPVTFDDKTQGVIELPGLQEYLQPGEHTVELKMKDGASMPYALAVNYYDVKPATSDGCQVDLSVALSDTKIGEGAVTEAKVTVNNLSDKPLPTPVAIIGIPGGLEVRHDQLKELVKSEKIAAYEVLGREVVLYWRTLEAKQQVRLPLSLVAAVPGTYTGPASRAYLYYTDEFKAWVDGVKVEITPAAK